MYATLNLVGTRKDLLMVDIETHAPAKEIVDRMSFLLGRIEEDQAELKALTVELTLALNVNFQTDQPDTVYNN